MVVADTPGKDWGVGVPRAAVLVLVGGGCAPMVVLGVSPADTAVVRGGCPETRETDHAWAPCCGVHVCGGGSGRVRVYGCASVCVGA